MSLVPAGGVDGRGLGRWRGIVTFARAGRAGRERERDASRSPSPAATGAGFMTAQGRVDEPATRGTQSETTTARVRNVLPIKINEVRFGTGANPTDQFIELYNASASAVDLSNWTPDQHAEPVGARRAGDDPGRDEARAAARSTCSASRASGLAAPADRGRDHHPRQEHDAGFEAGQKIDIDGETRTIVSVGTAAAAMTTVFIPVSTGPWITIPAGSTNLPVTNAAGFEVGQKIGIDIGGNYELATVTAVGKAATQTTLSAAAVAGATNIKVAASANMTAGDTLTVGTGGRKELVKVASVGRRRERHGRRPGRPAEVRSRGRASTCPTWEPASASRRPRSSRTRAATRCRRSAAASRSTARWQEPRDTARLCVNPRVDDGGLPGAAGAQAVVRRRSLRPGPARSRCWTPAA